MSLAPCQSCGQRAVGKLAAIYAWWFGDEDQRIAWRKRYCVGCLTTLLASLKSGASPDSPDLTVCPRCGCDSSKELSGIWMTVYPPKQPEREYALPMCVSCAELLRVTLSDGADRMADRSARAAALATTPDAGWDQVPW